LAEKRLGTERDLVYSDSESAEWINGEWNRHVIITPLTVIQVGEQLLQ
jgi:hypothetical protein